jgi:hypothetical protein
MNRNFIKSIIGIALLLSLNSVSYACDNLEIALNYYGVVNPKGDSTYFYAYLEAYVVSGYVNSWDDILIEGQYGFPGDVSYEPVDGCNKIPGGPNVGIYAIWIWSDDAGDNLITITANGSSGSYSQQCNFVVNEVYYVTESADPPVVEPGTNVTFTAISYPSCSLIATQWYARYKENSESAWSDWISTVWNPFYATFTPQSETYGNPLFATFSTPGIYQLIVRNGNLDTYKYSSEVTVGVIVDLDTDIDGDNDMDEIDDLFEKDKGGLAVRKYGGNDAPRIKIVMRQALPSTWSGNLVLTRNNNKVKVYDAETGGTEITFNGTDNKFTNSSLTYPKELWVEGINASASMQDIVLTLTAEGVSPTVKDEVNFTVLWVTITGAKYNSTDTLSNDNDKKTFLDNNVFIPFPSDSKLGNRLIYTSPAYASPPKINITIGNAVEFQATVSPSNFDPSIFNIGSVPDFFCLNRECVDDYFYLDSTHFGGSPGPDLSSSLIRDDTPEFIYDVDCPGITFYHINYAGNPILRSRMNFDEYASCDGQRCSELYPWHSATSVQMDTGKILTGTASSGSNTTLVDSSATWTPNEWNFIKITSGDGVGLIRRITTHDQHTITVDYPWGTTPSPGYGSGYKLMKIDTYTLDNTYYYGGDNKADDDYLPYLTYDLTNPG